MKCTTALESISKKVTATVKVEKIEVAGLSFEQLKALVAEVTRNQTRQSYWPRIPQRGKLHRFANCL